MNIGSRIEARLKQLKWDRQKLLAAVPDLTPQALSNLIRRGSKRSEWDEKIAAALGVSVLWLVYGRDLGVSEANRNQYDVSLPEEQFLVRAFRAADPARREAFLALARSVFPNQPIVTRRTGTK